MGTKKDIKWRHYNLFVCCAVWWPAWKFHSFIWLLCFCSYCCLPLYGSIAEVVLNVIIKLKAECYLWTPQTAALSVYVMNGEPTMGAILNGIVLTQWFKGMQWWCWPWMVGGGMTLQGLSFFFNLLNIYRSLSLSPLLPAVSKTPTHMPPHAHERTHTRLVIRHTHASTWSDMQRGRYISSPTLIPMLPRTLDIVTQARIVSKSLHFEQNQAADRWMDGGGIRHPVPSSPHFLPNRYKLGMKSLAPCQFQSGTCSSCLPPCKLPPILWHIM